LKRDHEYSLYTDNSAFSLERIYNSTNVIGANTYPYVNGVIWKGKEGTMTIGTNRAGGVSIRN